MGKCGRPKGQQNPKPNLPEGDRSYRKWTPEEEDYLREKWGAKSARSVARTLRRSPKACYLKARKLRLGGVIDASGEITLRQLTIALGYIPCTRPKDNSLVRNGLPVHHKFVLKQSFSVVRLNEFWAWAKDHKAVIDFSGMEPFALGEEPPWVAAKRRDDMARRKTAHSIVWAEEDDSRLKCLVDHLTLTELAAEFGRTEGAVRARANRLGVGWKIRNQNKCRIWTEEEKADLERGLLDGKTFAQIAVSLGRSESSVRSTAQRIYGTNSQAKAGEIVRERNAKPKKASYKILNEHKGDWE